jgi:hypothetical protein
LSRVYDRAEIIGDTDNKINVEILKYVPVVINEHRVDYRRKEGDQRCDFIDYGRRISFENWRSPSAMDAALQLSAEKWKKGFTLFGDIEFKVAAVQAAVRLGIADKILNDDLRDLIDVEKKEWAKNIDHKPDGFDDLVNATGCEKVRVVSPKKNEFSTSKLMTEETGNQANDLDWRVIASQENPGLDLFSEKTIHVVVQMTHERRKQMEADGYKFAAIAKIGNKMYQGVINFDCDFDLPETDRIKLTNFLTAKFNNCEKPRWQVADGKLIYQSKDTCSIDSADLSDFFRNEIEPTMTKMSEANDAREKTIDNKVLQEIWLAQAAAIIVTMPNARGSALDLMASQRMRAIGYSKEDILGIIARVSPNPEAQGSQDYAIEIANKTFDKMSDSTLEKHACKIDGWRKIAKEIIAKQTPTETMDAEQVKKAQQRHAI